MAITGLHNVAMLDSSFLRESQSPVSRQCSNQDRTGTRASSLLQMWRELESEHLTNHPQVSFGGRTRSSASSIDLLSNYSFERQGIDDGNCSEDSAVVDIGCQPSPRVVLQLDDEDTNSSSSDLSFDLGEVERERVRQIFQEWMNSGVRAHATNTSYINNCSRAQWLGENERERVRAIREWVQMNSQHTGPCGTEEEQAADVGSRVEQAADVGSRVEQAAGIGSRVEETRNGYTCEVGPRKAIRRLCGRQALLDLLMRAERERKKELRCLQDNRPVSCFAHRNRIQALLRGRFLRNEPLQGEKCLSLAESELGLLRQRQTVSGLREEFLSRLDSFTNNSLNTSQSDGSPNTNINDHENRQLQSSDEPCIVNETSDQSESFSGEGDGNKFHSYSSQNSTEQDANNAQSTMVEEVVVRVQENEDGEQDALTRSVVIHSSETGDLENAEELQLSGSFADHISRRDNVNSTRVVLIEEAEGFSGSDGSEQSIAPEARDNYHDHIIRPSVRGDLRETPDLANNSGQSTTEHFYGQDISAGTEWQALVPENEESEWQQFSSVELNGLALDGDNQSFEEALGNDVENSQESHNQWHENHLQEALDNWLDGHSSRAASPVRSVNAFYFPDDDNVNSLELRELLRRRRVSNLLQSGFRENLDRLIQSYVERQAHASADSDAEESSHSPASIDQDQEQQIGVQTLSQSDSVNGTALVLPLQPATSTDPLWEHNLNDASWPHPGMHMHSGIDWDVINELRLDVAQLQQRVDNMQKMLEACMDMQLELQRAVRQEVSAALNRSTSPTDTWGINWQRDESKLNNVRKGICCMCFNNNINSLLYRCGHMCTCSKCAEKLGQNKGKCPMCCAPVVEVIRAYSLQ